MNDDKEIIREIRTQINWVIGYMLILWLLGMLVLLYYITIP